MQWERNFSSRWTKVSHFWPRSSFFDDKRSISMSYTIICLLRVRNPEGFGFSIAQCSCDSWEELTMAIIGPMVRFEAHDWIRARRQGTLLEFVVIEMGDSKNLHWFRTPCKRDQRMGHAVETWQSTIPTKGVSIILIASATAWILDFIALFWLRRGIIAILKAWREMKRANHESEFRTCSAVSERSGAIAGIPG
jgi:hypothetical protein